MNKIDAHQHFWDLQQFNYPWLTPTAQVLYRNFEPAALEPVLVDNGVQGTILVQATHSQAETEWLLSLAQIAPFIKGVVGWLDFTAPDVEEKLEALLAKGPLCGLRHQVHDESDRAWLLQNQVVAALNIVSSKSLTYDLLIRPVHLQYLPALFRAVPNGRWVIDHLAKPEIKDRKLEPWLAGMQRAAQYPNVYCKLSGMITEANHCNWSIENVRVYFEQVLELFGPARLLFGSDWPVCLLAGSYAQVNDLVMQLVSSLTESEQVAIWSGTACEVYQIEL